MIGPLTPVLPPFPIRTRDTNSFLHPKGHVWALKLPDVSLSFLHSVFLSLNRLATGLHGDQQSESTPSPRSLPQGELEKQLLFSAAGIPSFEYKSKLCRHVMEIKNSRTLVGWLRCREHRRLGVKHSCRTSPQNAFTCS